MIEHIVDRPLSTVINELDTYKIIFQKCIGVCHKELLPINNYYIRLIASYSYLLLLHIYPFLSANHFDENCKYTAKRKQPKVESNIKYHFLSSRGYSIPLIHLNHHHHYHHHKSFLCLKEFIIMDMLS